MTSYTGLKLLSVTIGWSYFIIWSLSFYPQLILNWRRKSVEGFSLDFANINAMGHTSYAVYTSNFRFNPAVQDEYRRRHDGHDSSVQTNDVAFAVHASFNAIFQLGQTWWYPRGSNKRVSTYNRIVITLAFAVATVNLIAVWTGYEQTIDFLYKLSYFKVYVSIAKYIPQAWYNYKRKSTVGWSIVNILMDFTGGILSLIQLFLDAHIENDWSSVTGNIAKLALSLLTLAFDTVFIVQHYVLYRGRVDVKIVSEAEPTEDERTALMG